jgi:hypothetical protein
MSLNLHDSVDEPAPPPIGHNQPPTPLTPEEIAAHLEFVTVALKARKKELLEGAVRFHTKFATITDDETCGKASDFAGGKGAMAAWLKTAEEQREKLKAPYLTGGRVVDGWFKQLREDIETEQKKIREKAAAYLNDKEERAREIARKEAEAAAQRAAEAERAAMASLNMDDLNAAATAAREADIAQAHADAKPAEHSRVYGALGTTMSLRQTWKFDPAQSDLMALARAVAAGKAPIEYLQFNEVRINFAVKSEKLRECPGLHIAEVRSAI